MQTIQPDIPVEPTAEERIRKVIESLTPIVAPSVTPIVARWPTNIETKKTPCNPETGSMRAFDSGATRDEKEGKLEYEECLSPIALEAYAEYMLECSIQSDGRKRPGDNWQKGIPIEAYMDSLLRHVFDLWKLHRGYKTVDRITGKPVTIRKALCAILFNAFGYLHEHIKRNYNGKD